MNLALYCLDRVPASARQCIRMALSQHDTATHSSRMVAHAADERAIHGEPLSDYSVFRVTS